MTNPLYDALFASNRKSGRTFLSLPDGTEITYQAFLAEAARFAHVLAEFGAKPGDRLALRTKKTPQALAVYAACVQAGIVFVPLNQAYTAAEVRYFLENSGAKILVCDLEAEAELAPVAVSTGTELLTLDAAGNGRLNRIANDAQGHFETVSRVDSDIAAILYTSGTTGRSKGAMLSQNNLLSNARVLCQEWDFGADDVLLHALPIYHAHGLFVATNVCLLANARMIFLPKFSTDAVIQALPNVTTMMGVPTFYTRLLNDERLSRDMVAHVRLFISGSAPMLADTHRAFQQCTGHEVLERYGMTETLMIAANPYVGVRQAGWVGASLPGITVRITDQDTGATLPPGSIGMIEVKGPNVFQGYWQMPEKTRSEFRDDGFFITGDLGRMDSKGNVQIVGRAKDIIITGGFNVYPKEVELLLDEDDAVMESAVIGVPHPDFGEGVIGLVVATPGRIPDLAAIQESLASELAKFKQPKELIVVESLPCNSMGKVQKNVLRQMFKGHLQG